MLGFCNSGRGMDRALPLPLKLLREVEIVMRKFFFAIIGSVVLYFAACLVAGGIAGGIAGSQNPEMAAEVGREAGIKIVRENQNYLIGGAVFLAVLGCGFGVLPGTREPAED